ncbi:hypothetical protein ACFY5D_18685 [Paeniglutamicibacter sp. NPDC012692]|uniref:hypothetical protein n=1 Tax=Paeniglutamicibacter sp. NPDC012692 TaxID=3364388 RepID=UPI00368DC623
METFSMFLQTASATRFSVPYVPLSAIKEWVLTGFSMAIAPARLTHEAVHCRRRIGILSKEDVLQVAPDRSVRGAVERSCTPQLEPAHVKPDDVAAMTKEDHASAFMAFASGPRTSYGRYLNSGDPSGPLAMASDTAWTPPA